MNSDSLCFILHNVLQDVDPNDEKSMLLLERMAVMKNGKVYKVNMYILDVGDSSLCFTNMDLLGQLKMQWIQNSTGLVLWIYKRLAQEKNIIEHYMMYYTRSRNTCVIKVAVHHAKHKTFFIRNFK